MHKLLVFLRAQLETVRCVLMEYLYAPRRDDVILRVLGEASLQGIHIEDADRSIWIQHLCTPFGKEEAIAIASRMRRKYEVPEMTFVERAQASSRAAVGCKLAR